MRAGRVKIFTGKTIASEEYWKTATEDLEPTYPSSADYIRFPSFSCILRMSSQCQGVISCKAAKQKGSLKSQELVGPSFPLSDKYFRSVLPWNGVATCAVCGVWG